MKQQRWFWISFGYATFIDALATWANLAFGVRESATKMLQVEAMVAGFAIVAIIGLWRLRYRFYLPLI